eukprot:GHVH01006419.1.p2 GENE.GHVH01006419.1~~GHVH01006419.1.p2  ORF type:complete len:477 (-),score=73.79 GHVH01006419.1:1602-2984(-)
MDHTPDHPISAPRFDASEEEGAELEFQEGEFEEIEIDKDAVEEDVESEDEEESLELPADSELIAQESDFDEPSTTFGSTLPDLSEAKYDSGKEVVVVAVRPELAGTPMVAAGGQGDNVTVLSTEDLSVITVLEEPEDTVNVMMWSPCGTMLALGCLSGDDVSGRIFIYSVTDNDFSLIQTLTGPGDDVECLDWHPSGQCIMAGFSDGTVWCWMTKTGNLYTILVGHGGAVTTGHFVEGGKRAITGSIDGSIIVWSMSTQSIDYHLRSKTEFFGSSDIDFSGGHSNAIICSSVHPSLPLLATGSEDHTVKIFNWETKRVVKTLTGFTDTIEDVKWLPNSSNHLILAAGSLDGSVTVWNGNFEWRPILQESHYLEDKMTCGGVTAISWMCTGNDQPAPEQLRNSANLISVSLDGTLRCWGFGGSGPQVFGGSTKLLVCVDSLAKSRTAFCGGDDGFVRKIQL